MKNFVFREKPPRSIAKTDYYDLMIEAIYCSEQSINRYYYIQRYIQEDGRFYQRLCCDLFIPFLSCLWSSAPDR